MQPGFEATTGDITVQVRVVYLDEQSQPEAGQFFWAYHITIINHGVETVQLLKRTWRITDANGRVVNVHGDGVVGKQPVLEPASDLNTAPARRLVRPRALWSVPTICSFCPLAWLLTWRCPPSAWTARIRTKGGIECRLILAC